jgi:single-stranded-DNA-specific exonuclease
MENLTELLETLLANRNLFGTDREKFLNPSYEHDLSDPFTMHDLERGVVRFYEALENKEKIVIYSDYDCDGVPGAVIMSDLMRVIGYKNVSYYIPDRQDEGYGLHQEALKQFIIDGVKLVITIDLGTTAVDQIAYAQINGIDVIVTDHHEPPLVLPRPYALINPKLGTYVDPMICGSGAIFQFVRGFIQKYGEYYKIPNGFEKWSLDMVGLATLSDMVPLVKENRVFAKYGMTVLQKTRRPGLVALLKENKMDPRYLSEEDVTFTITPRLNAASRMGSAHNAFELLATMEPTRGVEMAKYLSKINDERKSLVAVMMKEAKKKLEAREMGPIIFIGNPDWRAGVLGLVSGKLMDEYMRPVFVWGGEASDPHLKGSCRSDGSASVVSLMRALPEGALVHYGGHELAGGFSVSHEEIHFLEERLVTAYETIKIEISAEQKNKNAFEASLSLANVNPKTFSLVNQLAPFGVGNPKPVFLFSDIGVVAVKAFGKAKDHLELIVGQGYERKKAIAFFKTAESFSMPVVEGMRIDLLATMEMSYFMNRPELRLRIISIAEAGSVK